jgi:hypothetical protein
MRQAQDFCHQAGGIERRQISYTVLDRNLAGIGKKEFKTSLVFQLCGYAK